MIAVVAPLEHGHEVQATKISGSFLPGLDEPSRVRELSGGEDEQHGTAVDADVARVLEGSAKLCEVGCIVVLAGIGLLEEHLAVASGITPSTLPAVVGPGEAEREVRVVAAQDLGEGALKEPTAPKPIVPVDEAS